MFNKDLIYICKHVEEWPNECYAIRLDYDGEICFIGSDFEDFYPEGQISGKAHSCFISCEGGVLWGENYLKEEFLACKEYLSQQENLSVVELQDVISEKVISRIKESQSRHREAYKQEITPLLEVLQRRGVDCTEFELF